MITSLEKHLKKMASAAFSDGEAQKPAKRIAACKKLLKEGIDFIKQHRQEGGGGLEVAKARSLVIDELIRCVSKRAFADVYKTLSEESLPVAIVALGGYGREELSPHSDVDIMFLYPSKADEKDLKEAQDIMAQDVLYPLWDTGLKVGHSSRSLDHVFDEARADIQTKTSLLEARLITGSQTLYDGFQNSYALFYRQEKPQDYIRQRLVDQAERRKKFGGSVFMQEPDIKNGVGGLRDYHNTLWMAQVRLNASSIDDLAKLNYLTQSELKSFKAAYEYLLKTRNELHFMTQRPSDLLSLEMQPKIALKLGYKDRNVLQRVENFMRDYYKNAQDIYLFSQTVENRLSLTMEESKANPLKSVKDFLLARRKDRILEIDGFQVRGRQITSDNKKVFEEDPIRLVRIFRHKQKYDVKLDFNLKALIRASLSKIDDSVINSEDANRSFRSILQESGNVYPTLNSMHEHGVLGVFIPEWGKLTCLVQHEYYHRYTADVHTLHTIRELDNVFTRLEEPFAKYRTEIRKLRLPNLLYLILFLHDIGKANSIEDHATASVELAEPILERLEISEENRRLIRFIIMQHLEMARFWQKFDLDDPETAKAFAEKMETTEQLRLLYAHTFCDARGTAAGLWNNYKDSLHNTLFTRTLDVFENEGNTEAYHAKLKEMTRQELLDISLDDVSEEEINAHFQLLPERYFINSTSDDIILHIRLINRLLREISRAASVGTLKPVVDWRRDINRSFTVVNVVTWDRAGLFHKLAGALNIAGYNILSAKAISRGDNIAIDTFYVSESRHRTFNADKAQAVFQEHLTQSLVSDKDLYSKIKDVAKKQSSELLQPNLNPLAESFQPKVDVYHELTLKRTILEVQATDNLGLLYKISQILFQHGFDITFARINTERGIAIDTFYLVSSEKGQATDSAKLMELRDNLSDVLINESSLA